MSTEWRSPKYTLFPKESSCNASTALYPVDLLLFLDISQPASEGSSNSPMEKGDSVVIAQYALNQWNGFIASGEEQSRKAFLKAAYWLIDHAQRLGDDAIGWPLTYAHPQYLTQGSWLSSIAQGCGLSVLVRAYQLTGDECFLKCAHSTASTFERDILDGGVCTPIGPNGIFFEEVAVYPAAHTINGCVFSLLGLYDYVSITRNLHLQHYIQRVEATLHSIFDEFDIGFWTYADLLLRDLATPVQLTQQTALLEAIANYSKCPHCAERALLWKRYRYGKFSLFRYIVARRVRTLQGALRRHLQGIILFHAQVPNSLLKPLLRVCVAMPTHTSPGGIGTFLSRVMLIMADKWQIEYMTQFIRADVGKRVIHQFGRTWMTPWHFPQVWFYVLAGTRKLFSLIHQGANYGLIIPQDGVFSGAFAALVGKLTGVRVVCIDHSNLTWIKSQVYRVELKRDMKGRAWLWPLRMLVQFSQVFYWPSLRILAKFATAQADHLLSPGVPGDEIDEICHNLRIPLSRVTRFNVPIDMQKYAEFSAEKKAAYRASMNIPSDALVIAITVRLELEKGLDISIESISRVMASVPPMLRDRILVIIAGDGRLREWLEEEVRQRKLSHVFRMLGNISSEKVSSLLAVSDISLHTSTRGVCMPAAVLEGMAAGCAVIASNEPLANVHVLASERGIVVPACDVEQTSKALDRLLRDSDLRERMGKAAREYVALYHSTEAFRRVLFRSSYWSDLDQLLERQISLLEDKRLEYKQ